MLAVQCFLVPPHVSTLGGPQVLPPVPKHRHTRWTCPSPPFFHTIPHLVDPADDAGGAHTHGHALEALVNKAGDVQPKGRGRGRKAQRQG